MKTHQQKATKEHKTTKNPPKSAKCKSPWQTCVSAQRNNTKPTRKRAEAQHKQTNTVCRMPTRQRCWDHANGCFPPLQKHLFQTKLVKIGAKSIDELKKPQDNLPCKNCTNRVAQNPLSTCRRRTDIDEPSWKTSKSTHRTNRQQRTYNRTEEVPALPPQGPELYQV